MRAAPRVASRASMTNKRSRKNVPPTTIAAMAPLLSTGVEPPDPVGTVGACEVNTVGAAEGFIEGWHVGNADGSDDGWEVGSPEGCAVGCEEGWMEGCPVGSDVG